MSNKSTIPGGFSKMFNSAVLGGYVARVGSSGRQVYYAALLLANHEYYHRFRASLETISILSGCSKPTTRRGLRDLEKVGLMRVLEKPKPSSTREGGTPGLYQLEVPAKVDYFKGLPPLWGWNLDPEGGEESLPGAVKKGNPGRRTPETPGGPTAGVVRGAKNVTLKQDKRTRDSNKSDESLTQTVLLLQKAGLSAEACFRYANEPPDRIRAIIASVEARPHVRDRASLIERWLHNRWEVSREMLAAATEMDDEPSAERMLTDAGVGEPKRGELLADYDHDWIIRRCQDFKVRLDAGERKSPGWLVRAIEQGDYPEHPRLVETEKSVARTRRIDADAAARDAERSEQAKSDDAVDAWFAETDPDEIEAAYAEWRESLPPAARRLVSQKKSPRESRPFRAYIAEGLEALS